jgi:hypothetical protein
LQDKSLAQGNILQALLEIVDLNAHLDFEQLRDPSSISIPPVLSLVVGVFAAFLASL